LLRGNIFDSNTALEMGGAIFLDSSQAQKELVGIFYIGEINITDSENIINY
jgi:hypothetical protein